MSIVFEAAFAFVVNVEGGFSDDPRDRGNWTGGKVGVGELRGTKYGISAAAFPMLNIKNITLDQAKSLYSAHYWSPIQGDALPIAVAMVSFDCAVNQGVHLAVITLQQAVGADPDGWIGAETIGSANTRPAKDTVLEICARRAVAYAQGDMATDGLGWMRRLFRVAATADTAGARLS
jgi:lysozyme family protein